MADQQHGARPAARVLFIVPGGGRLKGDNEGGGREDKFVEIAAAWKTEKGGYRFTLDAVPVDALAGRSVTFILSPITETSSTGNTQQRNDRNRR